MRNKPRDKRGPKRGPADTRGARAARGTRKSRASRDARDPHAKRDPHAIRGASTERPSRDARPRHHADARDPRAGRERTAQAQAQAQALDQRRAQEAEQLRDAAQRLAARAPLRTHEWLWTTREGAERDLVEELLLAGKVEPRGVAPSLVASRTSPGARDDRLDLTFARQGFPISIDVHDASLETMTARIREALLPRLLGHPAYALHVWVPDSAEGNPLATRASSLETSLAAQLAAAASDTRRVDDGELRREVLPLAQICMYESDAAAAGVISSDRALSLAQGGRSRMRLTGEFPSRAARKLEEAFSWLGMSPGPGELCVDLGAAPGGWSWLLLERRARVIAVDPARMDERLQRDRRLTHVQGDAFKYTPDQTVDWLLCDMAWRPLEVAQMLGRWARQRYTRMLVANFKLPMKRKAEMVRELRRTLEAAGFTGIRSRQLYHDREEITLTARVR